VAISVAENTSAVTVVTATDADLPAQTLSYSIVGGADAALFTIDASTGALTFIAAPDFENPVDNGADNVYDVSVQVSDGAGRTDTQNIAVTVTGVNEGPVALADSFSVHNTDSLTIAGPGLLANDTDPEGDPITAVLVTGPQHGTLVLNADGSFTYTPDVNFAGNDSFTYQATDGSVDSEPIVVQLTVLNTGGPLPPSGSGGGSSGSGDSTTDDSDSDSDSEGGGSDPTVGDNPFRPTSNQGPRERHRDDSSQEVMKPPEPHQRVASAESVATEAAQAMVTLAKGVRRAATAAERQAGQALGDIVDADSQQLSLALVGLRNEIETAAQRGGYIAGSVAIASAATSAGYALWLLRGAHFATTFLATIPAWRRFDPLPLLSSANERRRDEGESLAEIASGQGLPANAPAAQEVLS